MRRNNEGPTRTSSISTKLQNRFQGSISRVFFGLRSLGNVKRRAPARRNQELPHRACTAGGSQAGFGPSQPGASGLLSWGSRFLQVSRAGFRTNSSSATVKQRLLGPATLVLSYTFSIQYQAGHGCNTGTPAQHTRYRPPPASSELQIKAQQRWSTHRGLVTLVLSSRTRSKRPAHQLFAGLWNLDSVKPRHQPTAAEGFWFAELEF